MGKRLQCQNCGEAYGWQEYFDYMLMLRSSTVDCYMCPEENYVVPGPFLKTLPLRILGLIFAVIVALAPVYLLSEIEPNGYDGYYVSIPRIAIYIGIATLVLMFLVVMKTINWKTGSLTLDKSYRSDSDYDIYYD